MQLLTRQEAATFLRISLRKLDALAAQGEIRYARLGNAQRCRVVYEKEELERFIKRKTVGACVDFDSLMHPHRNRATD